MPPCSAQFADGLGSLAEMADRLTRVMDAECIPIWLNRPIEALDNDKPVELLVAATTAASPN